MKLGLMIGFGAGIMTAVIASNKMKDNVIDKGKKMLKEKIIEILD